MSTEPLIDVAGTKMTHAQFAALAKERGWGDPTGIDIKGIQKAKESEFEGGTAPSTYKVKEASGREHEVSRYGGQLVNSSSEFEDGTGPRTPEGWSVWAGNIPGKRNTRVLYGYDDAGNLTGVNLAQDSRWYEDAAPLIAMAAGPLAGAVAPGLAASIGSATGLGTLGSNMVAQGAISGGISALTGGDFLKGALTGAVGAAVIPEIAGIATGMGVDKALANTIAKGLVRGTSAALSGGSFAAGAASAGLEHIYGMVAAETGAPVDVVKAVGSAAGLPAAVNSAVSGGAKPASGASGASGTSGASGASGASGISGLGSLTPAQAALLGAAAGQKAQQAKPQAAPAQSAAGARPTLFDGSYFAGGGMVKRFDGSEDSFVELDPGAGLDAGSGYSDTPYTFTADDLAGVTSALSDQEVEEYLNSVSPDNQYDDKPYTFTPEDLAKAPTSVIDKIVSGLGSAAKAAFTKPDGSLDFTKLAALAGATYSYNRNQQAAVDLSGVGTKAGIASLTSAREQVPYQSDAYRTPGSGGRRYFTDVKYADKTNADAVAAAQQAAETQARGLAALQSKSGGVYGTLVNPLAGSGGTAGSGNNMGPGFVAPATSNGGITSGSGYGPGGSPEQAPAVTNKPAPETTPTTPVFGAGYDGSQSDSVGFDEQAYLAANPDVAAAVAAGDYRSGREHYLLYGAKEGRSGVTRPLTPAELELGLAQLGSQVSYGGASPALLNSLKQPTQAPAPSSAPSRAPVTGNFVTGGGNSFTPQQTQDAIAANTARIKQDLAGVKTDAELNAYLVRTGFTPEQLAIATGYSAADIHAKANQAWHNQPGVLNTQQWLETAYAPTSDQAPTPGMVIGGVAPAPVAPAPVAPAPVAPAPAVPDYYAPIQADIANLNLLGNQNALNSYLANTTYSADQLAAASGYSVADVQAAMQNAQSYSWYSEGGQVRGYAEGGYLDGATNGQSDEIPATIEGEEQARLSHGEFVVPADVVAALGGGNSNAGAEVLYDMMDRIREQAFGSKQQMRPVDQNTLPA